MSPLSGPSESSRWICILKKDGPAFLKEPSYTFHGHTSSGLPVTVWGTYLKLLSCQCLIPHTILHCAVQMGMARHLVVLRTKYVCFMCVLRLSCLVHSAAVWTTGGGEVVSTCNRSFLGALKISTALVTRGFKAGMDSRLNTTMNEASRCAPLVVCLPWFSLQDWKKKERKKNT